MKQNLNEFLGKMLEDIMVDSTEKHDCDNCNAKGMCPIEDDIREFKAKRSEENSKKEAPKKGQSAIEQILRMVEDVPVEKSNYKKLQKESVKDYKDIVGVLNDIFFDGEVPKEVKVQTERIERIINAKNKLNSNVEELLFTTTIFGKKINGNPDFSQVESFALYIEDMNRRMEELIKYYKSQPKKKKVLTKEEFKKAAEEMFTVFIKMIKETFDLGKIDEKAMSQVGILNNFNTYADDTLINTQSKNMEAFKVYLAKYLHLESKSFKNLILLTTPEAEYLLEVVRDVIIRTFMENEYKEESSAK